MPSRGQKGSQSALWKKVHDEFTIAGLKGASFDSRASISYLGFFLSTQVHFSCILIEFVGRGTGDWISIWRERKKWNEKTYWFVCFFINRRRFRSIQKLDILYQKCWPIFDENEILDRSVPGKKKKKGGGRNRGSDNTADIADIAGNVRAGDADDLFSPIKPSLFFVVVVVVSGYFIYDVKAKK